MINKKGVWFLTLFSLILVLSVYYITMPPELLIATSKEVESDNPSVEVKDSSLLLALRVEEDENIEKEIESLKKVISDSESSIEDKNTAFEKMKELNSNRSLEEKLEEKIKTKMKLDSFIKISKDNVSATINSDKHDTKLANNIMRLIQEEFTTNIKITVKFQTK